MTNNLSYNLTRKKNTHYAVKGVNDLSLKGVDLSKRTVKGILNTSYWIDSDLDMIIPGAVSKSLNENGVGSNGNAKIKHQIDHSTKAADTIGRFDVLEETEVEGKQVLYFESFLPASSNDHLIKYQEGLYDQHSIGFRYIKLEVAEKDSSSQDYLKNWEIYYPLALNPEVADKYGYFYVVKEYQLFEGSVVTFGANSLTAYLGVKSKDKEIYLTDLFNRLDFLKRLKNNEYNLEIRQLKQIISELVGKEPSIKETFCNKEPSLDNTPNTFLQTFLQELKK